jgi:hypothetical protein
LAGTSTYKCTDARLIVVAETVVGATTGVVSAPKGYFTAMHEVCQRYGALLILDEVMSGMGREFIDAYFDIVNDWSHNARHGNHARMGELRRWGQTRHSSGC